MRKLTISTRFLVVSFCVLSIIFVNSKNPQKIISRFLEDPFYELRKSSAKNEAKNEIDSELKIKLQKTSPSWFLEQIKDDFSNIVSSPLSKIHYDNMESFIANNNRSDIYRIKIYDNKIYYKFYNTSKVDDYRLDVMLKVLSKISQKTKLPNVDFFISAADIVTFEIPEDSAPLFTFAFNKKHRKNLILIPDSLTLANFGKIYYDILKLNNQTPWDQKINKAYWRGGTTGATYDGEDFFKTFSIKWTKNNYLNFSRTKLVDYSMQYPKILDAKFVGFSNLDEETLQIFKEKYVNAKNETKAEQLKYKIQISVDGICATYPGLLWRLLSNSVTLKQDSDDVQFFYNLLKPMVHYVPINHDMSDLISKINWVINNDKEAQKISESASKLVQENLKITDLYWYIYVLLSEYSKLVNFAEKPDLYFQEAE